MLNLPIDASTSGSSIRFQRECTLRSSTDRSAVDRSAQLHSTGVVCTSPVKADGVKDTAGNESRLHVVLLEMALFAALGASGWWSTNAILSEMCEWLSARPLSFGALGFHSQGLLPPGRSQCCARVDGMAGQRLSSCHLSALRCRCSSMYPSRHAAKPMRLSSGACAVLLSRALSRALSTRACGQIGNVFVFAYKAALRRRPAPSFSTRPFSILCCSPARPDPPPPAPVRRAQAHEGPRRRKGAREGTVGAGW